jgi:hypothetical protein
MKEASHTLIYNATTRCGGGNVHDVPGLITLYRASIRKFNTLPAGAKKEEARKIIENVEEELYKIGNKPRSLAATA